MKMKDKIEMNKRKEELKKMHQLIYLLNYNNFISTSNSTFTFWTFMCNFRERLNTERNTRTTNTTNEEQYNKQYNLNN